MKKSWTKRFSLLERARKIQYMQYQKIHVANDVFSAPGHAHFHPGVAGVEVETGVAEEAGVVVKDMVVEELVLLAEEVIGLLRLIFIPCVLIKYLGGSLVLLS